MRYQAQNRLFCSNLCFFKAPPVLLVLVLAPLLLFSTYCSKQPSHPSLTEKESLFLKEIGINPAGLSPSEIDSIKPLLAPYLELEAELKALADSMASEYPDIDIEYVDGAIRFTDKPAQE